MSNRYSQKRFDACNDIPTSIYIVTNSILATAWQMNHSSMQIRCSCMLLPRSFSKCMRFNTSIFFNSVNSQQKPSSPTRPLFLPRTVPCHVGQGRGPIPKICMGSRCHRRSQVTGFLGRSPDHQSPKLMVEKFYMCTYGWGCIHHNTWNVEQIFSTIACVSNTCSR